jgi:hypothetical protein
MSLFRTKGGKPSTKRLPSDTEGLALAVGIAMQWAKLHNCSNKNFFVNVGNECKRLRCTPSEWQHDELTYFATEKISRQEPLLLQDGDRGSGWAVCLSRRGGAHMLRSARGVRRCLVRFAMTGCGLRHRETP